MIRYKGFAIFERTTFDLWAETKAAQELIESNGVSSIALPSGGLVGYGEETSLGDLKAYIDALENDAGVAGLT